MSPEESDQTNTNGTEPAQANTPSSNTQREQNHFQIAKINDIQTEKKNDVETEQKHTQSQATGGSDNQMRFKQRVCQVFGGPRSLKSITTTEKSVKV